MEQEQRIQRVPNLLFEGEEAVLHVIERIVAPLGLRVDKSSPWVDARLSDGSRVHTHRRCTPFLPPGLSTRRVSTSADKRLGSTSSPDTTRPPSILLSRNPKGA
jgi:pilus assembly protein CpaF